MNSDWRLAIIGDPLTDADYPRVDLEEHIAKLLTSNNEPADLLPQRKTKLPVSSSIDFTEVQR